jgi:ABC-type anion transport system duplicated permease subunit
MIDVLGTALLAVGVLLAALLVVVVGSLIAIWLSVYAALRTVRQKLEGLQGAEGLSLGDTDE